MTYEVLCSLREMNEIDFHADFGREESCLKHYVKAREIAQTRKLANASTTTTITSISRGDDRERSMVGASRQTGGR